MQWNIKNKFIGNRGLRSGWGIVLFVTLATVLNYFAILIMMPYLRQYNYRSPQFIIIFYGLSFIVVLSVTMLVGLSERRGVTSYGLGGPQILRHIGGGVFWGFTLLSVLVGELMVTQHFVIRTDNYRDPGLVFYGLAWIIAFFLISVMEETLFRGYLQFALSRIIGFWPAGILLSIVYGLAHLANSAGSKFSAIEAVLFGLILVLCLRCSGSLWWGIGFHGAWNWAEGFFYGVPISSHVIEGNLFQFQALRGQNWSGGANGPEGSFLVLTINLLTVIVVLALFGSRKMTELKLFP